MCYTKGMATTKKKHKKKGRFLPVGDLDFRRPGVGWWVFSEQPLWVNFNDGERLILSNEFGNVMFNGTVALFNKCVEKGWFTPIAKRS